MARSPITEATLDTWDRTIRAGSLVPVRTAVEVVRLSTIPVPLLPRFAQIARRVGLVNHALRALHGRVRDAAGRGTGTPQERVEYAASLIQAGALSEASELLAAEKGLPEVALYTAHLAIVRREYGEAISHFRRYLETPGLAPYARLVARVAVAEALTVEGHKTLADRMVQELLREASLRQHRLLLRRAMKVAAQVALQQGQLDSAERLLARAEEEAGEDTAVGRLLLRKWRAIARVRARRELPAALAELASVRAEALRLGGWELVRDCDRYRAVLLRDRALYHYVYFGTPYESYRRRLVLAFGETEPPDTFRWTGAPDVDAAGETPLDLAAGVSTAKGALRTDELRFRMLECLTSDFYRPLRTANLFLQVFPDERYHPVHSPPRVHVAVRRLRRWLASQKYAVTVSEGDGEYRLVPTAACPIRVGRHAGATPAARLAEELRGRWGDAAVSLGDLSDALEMPYRSAHRLVVQALEEGLLVREGAGKKTRYRCVPAESAPAQGAIRSPPKSS